MAQPATAIRFAVCIRNTDAEDLELRKVYQVVPSTSSTEEGFLRVIDESGKDYVYPADYFIMLELPQAANQALLQAA
jgi:hypothetical protein